MKNEQDIESLKSEIEELKMRLDEKSTPKPNKYAAKLKETASRTLINVIDDLPTTLIGVGTAASILVVQWPNIDQSTLIEAFGIGSLGAATNSKVAPKQTLEDNYLNDTEELG
jgi:hypothetical protein